MQHNTYTHRPTSNKQHTRCAFTLIEVLTVVTIIAILIAISLGAYSVASNKSKESLTQSLMRSIVVGIDQFQTDFGYEPPLLVPDLYAASLVPSNTLEPAVFSDTYEFVDPLSQNNASEALRNTRYFSTVSLTAYLIGNCELAPLIYVPQSDPDRHDGAQGPGIRNPGTDRAWGGAQDRDQLTHRPALTGQVYGPYVDIARGNATRSEYEFRPVNEHAEFDPLLLDKSRRSFYVFLDAWGSPIRYYRNIPKRDPLTNELSVINAPIELLTQGLLGVANKDMKEEDRMAILTASNKHIFQSSFNLLSAGEDNIFASTNNSRSTSSGPSANDGFTFGSIPAGFDLSATLKNTTGDLFMYKKLTETVSNNIVVSP